MSEHRRRHIPQSVAPCASGRGRRGYPTGPPSPDRPRSPPNGPPRLFVPPPESCRAAPCPRLPARTPGPVSQPFCGNLMLPRVQGNISNAALSTDSKTPPPGSSALWFILITDHDSSPPYRLRATINRSNVRRKPPAPPAGTNPPTLTGCGSSPDATSRRTVRADTSSSAPASSKSSSILPKYRRLNCCPVYRQQPIPVMPLAPSFMLLPPFCPYSVSQPPTMAEAAKICRPSLPLSLPLLAPPLADLACAQVLPTGHTLAYRDV